MREKILELFKVSHSTDTYLDFVDLMCDQMLVVLGDPVLAAQATSRIKSVVAEEMPKLTEQFVRLYEDTYNEEEIDAMIAYHNSPVGKKNQAVRKHLTVEGARIGRSIESKVTAALQSIADELDAA